MVLTIIYKVIHEGSKLGDDPQQQYGDESEHLEMESCGAQTHQVSRFDLSLTILSLIAFPCPQNIQQHTA